MVGDGVEVLSGKWEGIVPEGKAFCVSRVGWTGEGIGR